jgi:hypothetical protein
MINYILKDQKPISDCTDPFDGNIMTFIKICYDAARSLSHKFATWSHLTTPYEEINELPLRGLNVAPGQDGKPSLLKQPTNAIFRLFY